jgi:hypothetical protein
VPGTGELKTDVFFELNLKEDLLQAPVEFEPAATVPVLDSPFLQAENVALHQGHLGIQHAGKLTKKFFVLYTDRLDYFETPVDAVSGKRPLGRIALSEVTSHEVFGCGLILDLLGRKVGLKADDDADVKQWDTSLKQAIAAGRPTMDVLTTSRGIMPVAGRPRSSSPRKRVRPRVYDFRHVPGCEACPHCGGCSASPPIESLSFGSASRRARSVDSAVFESSSAAGSSAVLSTSLSMNPSNTSSNSKQSWVMVNTFERFNHANGRQYANSDVARNVNTKVTAIKEDAQFIHMTPVTSKITNISGNHTAGNGGKLEAKVGSLNPSIAHKVNVPDEESRLSIRKVEDDRRDRHHLPHKVTQQTKYGEYPNYQQSNDRTYVRKPGPDAIYNGVEPKITNSPSRIKTFSPTR